MLAVNNYHENVLRHIKIAFIKSYINKQKFPIYFENCSNIYFHHNMCCPQKEYYVY